MVTSNSRSGGQLLAGRWPGGARAPPRSRCPGRPAGGPARPSSAARGTRTAPRASRSRTCRAPCRSISSSALRPCGQRSLDRPAGGAVLGPAVHDGPLEELAGLAQARRTRRRRRSGSARRRPRRGAGLRVVIETESQTSGKWVADVGGDGALADGGGPGEDDQPAGGRRTWRRGPAQAEWSNRDSSAAIWLAPSPRTRRLSEMPTSSMIWLGADPADAGHGLQQRGDLHLADDVVALAVGDDLGQGPLRVLQPVLDRSPLTPGDGGLLQRLCALLGGERGKGHVRSPRRDGLVRSVASRRVRPGDVRVDRT